MHSPGKGFFDITIRAWLPDSSLCSRMSGRAENGTAPEPVAVPGRFLSSARSEEREKEPILRIGQVSMKVGLHYCACVSPPE
jgi:hypothetical protein